MTDDLTITPSHALALTQDELATLKAILQTGDRGGLIARDSISNIIIS